MKIEDFEESVMDFSFYPFNLMSKTRFKLLRLLLMFAGFIWFCVFCFPLLIVMLVCMTYELVNDQEQLN